MDIIGFLFNQIYVHAISTNNPDNPPKLVEIFQLLFPLIDTLLYAIAPIILVIMIIVAGVKRLMAADNSKAVIESSQTLFWAVIGYAVVLLSYVIVRFGASFLGYDIAGNSGINL